MGERNTGFEIAEDRPGTQGKILQIDEGALEDHLGKVIRGTVEETLNGLLDAEADRICGAGRYSRSSTRVDTRAGHYQRKLSTRAGEVTLKVPKLRKLPFETAIIERYKRRESSVEEALVEMYLAGVSVRRVESITEVLWGSRVSPGTISNLNRKIYDQIESWRNRPLQGTYPYIFLDGIWLKMSWGGEVQSVSVLVALGVDEEGYRDVLGVALGCREDGESWRSFLRHLKERGLSGVRLVTSDKALGLVEVLGEFFPEALWQRCVVHFERNVLKDIPRNQMEPVSRMLRAVYAQESREEARTKAKAVAAQLRERKLASAARTLERGIDETLSYYAFPGSHWRKIRTNNTLERLNREIRRRTNVVGSFPDGQAALMLVAARLRYVLSHQWGTRKYMNMEPLHEAEIQQSAS
ncbi:IS256 family transposase [Aminomonas paucivorans]|uniref:IS256 family transposase n=1 Tax=Aminomonas paucivorans TaxID=81412 RepID=UPI00333438E7